MSRPKGSERETTEYLAMLSRLIRRAGERVADADEFELYELVALRATLEDAIRVGVRGQRKRRSWAHIAAALGITRQAAHERYGDKPRDRSDAAASCPAEALWDDHADYDSHCPTCDAPEPTHTPTCAVVHISD